MNTLKPLFILALFFAGEVSAAIYKVDFSINLTQHIRNNGASTENLKEPIKGSTSLVYDSSETFKDGISLRNWNLSHFEGTKLMGEASNRHVEQVLTQTKVDSGWKTVYNAQTETFGLDIGFEGTSPNDKVLGYENFFLAALRQKYEFMAGVTTMGDQGLDLWSGSAKVTGFSAVPLPGALYLFATGLAGLYVNKRKR